MSVDVSLRSEKRITVYCCGDKSYPCLVGIGLNMNIQPLTIFTTLIANDFEVDHMFFSKNVAFRYVPFLLEILYQDTQSISTA